MQIKEFKEKEVDVKDKSLSNKVYFAVGGIVLAVILIVAVFINCLLYTSDAADEL